MELDRDDLEGAENALQAFRAHGVGAKRQNLATNSQRWLSLWFALTQINAHAVEIAHRLRVRGSSREN